LTVSKNLGTIQTSKLALIGHTGLGRRLTQNNFWYALAAFCTHNNPEAAAAPTAIH
jgi:hypothetical protein